MGCCESKRAVAEDDSRDPFAAAAEAAGASEEVDSLPSASEELTEPTPDRSALQTVQQSVSNLTAPITAPIKRGSQVIQKSSKKVVKNTAAVGTAAVAAVGTGVHAVGTGMQTVGTAAVEGVKTGAATVATGVQTVGNAAVAGVQTVGTAAVTGVQTVGNAAVTGVTTVGTAAVTGVTTVGKGVQKGAQKMGKGAHRVSKRLSAVGVRFFDPTAALDILRPIGDKMNTGAHHVRNIFAKPLQELLHLDSYKPPVHPKSPEAREFIQNALRSNFVFDSLTARDLKPMVDAFEKVEVEEDHVVIKQGDEGDYFYIITAGEVDFLVDDHVVGQAGSGVSFGELALLYTCPRAATVRTKVPTTLLRVDQTCFRYILRKVTETGEGEKTQLLKGISFLQDLAPSDMNALSRVMIPKRFKEGDYLVKKGEQGRNFYIIKTGRARVTDLGTNDYDDIVLNPGDHFGERALLSDDAVSASVVAMTEGLAFRIDKFTFEKTLGRLSSLVVRSQDLRQLKAIRLLVDSKLDKKTMMTLAKMVKDTDFKENDIVVAKDKIYPAALYLVRKGRLEITHEDGTVEIKEANSYFGEDQLLTDRNQGTKRAAIAKPQYKVRAMESCSVGMLMLKDCRKLLDTTHLGLPQPTVKDSMRSRGLKLKDLKRHRILGAGTFGQVWLVSRTDSHNEKKTYALKVQSKYELVDDGQAKAVVYEKNIMAKLKHPFLISLLNSYQDDKCVYMVMDLVQGGELYNVIHKGEDNGLPEDHAMFYTAGIAEGLSYMHRRGYVYRDLKPENVLVNSAGYPVIIDFGFVKYVEDKTFTLCGTPLYLAPEVILNRGHNGAADHWSLGVLLYEMLTGKQPFYKEGMQQMDLFRAIVKGVFTMPEEFSPSAAKITRGFLTRNPSQRLGSLAGGEDDILNHVWFKSIDFDELRLESIAAPFIPKIKDPLDGSNFEDWSHLDDKTKQSYPKLTSSQAAIFKDF